LIDELASEDMTRGNAISLSIIEGHRLIDSQSGGLFQCEQIVERSICGNAIQQYPQVPFIEFEAVHHFSLRSYVLAHQHRNNLLFPELIVMQSRIERGMEFRLYGPDS
jgi:hypothetical protein